jgi:hypothetical protein
MSDCTRAFWDSQVQQQEKTTAEPPYIYTDSGLATVASVSSLSHVLMTTSAAAFSISEFASTPIKMTIFERQRKDYDTMESTARIT